ncbi:hypothetical protein QYE76_009352 [Lolium multiflorum]|uniref:Leucine-rich repeat-containing N-terminal plant-type domain-containing protein n=1 Tax=Lolium multiflorum TaxID=4521 RepID=A0AAD8TV50_LOLMU|nr:hypothetical protein QYE76_009352 [Lolium multiflorum]
MVNDQATCKRGSATPPHTKDLLILVIDADPSEQDAVIKEDITPRVALVAPQIEADVMESMVRNNKICLLILFMLLICTCGRTISPQSKAESEAKALLTWKSTFMFSDANYSSPLWSWSPATSTCSSWSGIKCNAAGHITQLTVPGAGITGTLDAFDFITFLALTSLNLSGNHLMGTIPANVSLLTSLTSLDLSNNNLTGGIPVALGTLHHLRVLLLRDNPLGGPIPASLAKLGALQRLDLQAAHLVDKIPVELGHLGALTFLDLSRNNLSGGLPPSFPRMREMREFYLS